MIQVLNRAFDILELIASNVEKEWSLSEVANKLNLNHGTCANIIKTLVNRNYLEQMGAKKGYRLGFMPYQIVSSQEFNQHLLSESKSFIDQLAKELNETVILSTIKNGRRICNYEAMCDREIMVRTNAEISAYRATTGRMILANYSDKEITDFIRLTGLPDEKEWPEIKSEEDLIRELKGIREKQIEITCNSDHVVGLATPIFKKGKIIASLGVYLPDIRFSRHEKDRIVSEMLKTTELINQKYNPVK